MTLPDELKQRKRAMTVAEVAELFTLSKQQMYKLVSAQRIPYFRVGGSIRFDPSVLAQWLNQRSDGWFRPRSDQEEYTSPKGAVNARHSIVHSHSTK